VSARGVALARPALTWRPPVVAWAATRLLVLVAGLVASAALGVPTRGTDPSVPRAVSLLGGWDTTWYLDIARHGYQHDVSQVGTAFTNLAFFPLLPGVMALALAVGLNPFITALCLSNLVFLGALTAVHGLTAHRFGAAAATRATWALALLPPATYAFLAYTEGLTLALGAAAALAAIRRRWALAGAAAALAALARPPGTLVALLLVLLAWRDPAPRRARRIALAAAPTAVAVAAFLGWMQVARGSWDLPFRAQRAWDRGQIVTGLVTDGPSEIEAGIHRLIHLQVSAAWTSTVRDLAAVLVFGWLLVRLWRREGGLRSPWVAYSLAVLALPLSTGTIASFARFGVVAFPLMWPLGDWLGDDRRRWTAYTVLAVAITCLLVAQLSMRSP
jgi:hypothetical protein